MIFQTLAQAIEATRQQQAYVWKKLLPDLYLIKDIWGGMFFVYRAPNGWQIQEIKRDDWKLMREFV